MNPSAISPNLLLFVPLAGLAALSSVGVVACRSAVRSALCLVATFFSLAFLYFTLGAEMLGITQVVVYAGAIMVLFVFVIMLLNLGGVQQALLEKNDPKLLLGGGLGFALFAILAVQVLLPLQAVQGPRTDLVTQQGESLFGSPPVVGRTLFTLYAFPLEIAGVLLLMGIVGSILLAKRKI